jgi:glutaconate CoA-transferase subunit B
MSKKKMPKKIKLTLDEIMCSVAAREIKDGDVVMIGHGYPMLTGYLAKKTHAPHAVLITECGLVDPDVYRPMQHPNDFSSTMGVSMCTDIPDLFASNLFRGYVDVGFLAAAEVDKYGNINTSYIGGKHFAGSGGANEIAGYAKRTIILLRHGRFVENCEYITTPGYLEGYNSRYEAGLPEGTGPSLLVSTKGVFRFDEKTKEMYLESYYPGITVEEIQEGIPWKLKIASKLNQTILPTEEELRMMREFAPTISLGRSFYVQIMMNYMQKFMEEAQKRK